MEPVSRSSDDDDEFGKRNGSAAHKGDLIVKGDRRSSDPSTPRSKHSATEQRRRSKINDRLQIIRELIPSSDQKRDTASFLLEVIEYIRFLQQKVQKYEASYPGGNQENEWEKVYFRSIWKSARNTIQGPLDDATYHSQVLNNGSASSGFTYSGRFDDKGIPVAQAMVSNSQIQSESDNMTTDVSDKTMENPPVASMSLPSQSNFYTMVGNETTTANMQQRLIPEGEDFASHSQADCDITGDILNEQDELAIDEDTVSISSIYSQGVLTSLTQAFQNSDVDLSQASIAVQINLGKRVIKRPAVSTSTSNKDREEPLSEHQPKRLRPDDC